MFIQYVSLILLLFFITFFIDVFAQYIRTKTIVPQKMFTYKQGGLFEHYILVGMMALVIGVLHAGFDLSPFGDNLVSRVISIVTLVSVGFVFLVFIFIFLFYFIAFLYTQIAKIEDRQAFYGQHNHRLVMTAMVLATVMMLPVLIIGVLGLFGVNIG